MGNPSRKQPSLMFLAEGSHATSEAGSIFSSDSSSEEGLGFLDGVAFVVSCCAGAGMFFAPGIAASSTKSPCGAILAFILGGLLTMAGALCFSELGTTFVSAGAESHYLKRAFGRSVSFSFTWTMFLVIGSGAVAVISVVTGNYIVEASGFEVHPFVSKLVAVAVIFFSTSINLGAPRIVPAMNKLLLCTKIGTSAVVVLGAIVGPMQEGDRAASFLFQGSHCFEGTDWTGGFIGGVVVALMAYSGWNMLNPMTQELRDPARDVPRIYTVGMGITVATALAFSFSFYSVLDRSSLTDTLMYPFGVAVFGKWFGHLLAGLAAICCFGSANGMIMGSSRIVQSAALDGLFPRAMGIESSEKVPHVAMTSFSVWSSVLVLGTGVIDVVVQESKTPLEVLIKFYTIGQWFFFVLVVASLIRLRYKEPRTERPYSVNAYPFLPIAFIVLSLGILLTETLPSLLEPEPIVSQNWFDTFGVSKASATGVDIFALIGFLIALVGYVLMEFGIVNFDDADSIHDETVVVATPSTANFEGQI